MSGERNATTASLTGLDLTGRLNARRALQNSTAATPHSSRTALGIIHGAWASSCAAHRLCAYADDRSTGLLLCAEDRTRVALDLTQHLDARGALLVAGLVGVVRNGAR